MDTSFNLIDEPWIRVLDTDCAIKEVSLRDALLDAHRYPALAGESPAQDAAVLRLLIAVVHTVFYRTDERDAAEFRDVDDALDRWEAIWKMKRFPETPIRAYLEQWHSRFDLLDAERPFYQVPNAEIGTPHTSAKLNGTVLQSENKLRIFASRTENFLDSLSFAEATRWLIYLQGFDDASVKPKTAEGKRNVKNKPGSARSWLGNLGLIYAVGDTLFDTVWLNAVFLKDGETLYAEPKPNWEQEHIRTGEYTEIPQPDNLPELLTLQTRRVLLKRDQSSIIGYAEYCGDLLAQQDAFAEPMTVWKPLKKKAETVGYIPRTHSPSRQLWRDFSSVAVITNGNRLPGITYWLMELKDKNCIEQEELTRFTAVSALYDSSGSSVTNTVSDTLSFHTDLLSAAGRHWQKLIEEQVHFCDKLADALGVLAGELSVAAGNREIEKKRPVPPAKMSSAEEAKAQFYYRIDVPFRQWMLSPQAGQSSDKVTELITEWQNKATRIVRELGKELVDEAGEVAFIGRWIKTDDQAERHYSSAEAFNRFLGKIGNA